MGTDIGVVHSGSYVGIRQVIDGYIENMQELIHSKYTMRDSMNNYLGMGKVQKSPYHEQLYKDVKKEVEALVQQLDAVEDELMAERAVRTILTYSRGEFAGMEDSIRLALISIEALAIPLLSYMNEQDIRELRDEYAARYSVKDMMPRQKELYRRMCELSGEKKTAHRQGFLSRFQ